MTCSGTTRALCWLDVSNSQSLGSSRSQSRVAQPLAAEGRGCWTEKGCACLLAILAFETGKRIGSTPSLGSRPSPLPVPLIFRKVRCQGWGSGAGTSAGAGCRVPTSH